MPSVSMRQLLEAGVHFGHQTRRWNPKMRPYIFAERNGIHIIDLAQTVKRLETALDFVRETVARGESVLFVGTKKQAQEPIAEEATRAGMPYVNKRWLGGMLTNFVTIKKRLGLLDQLEARQQAGDFERLPKKEAAKLTEELNRLQRDARRHPQDEAPARARCSSSIRSASASPSPRRNARDPGRRHGRHERRPGRARLHHPGQRRRDPRRSGCCARWSPTRRSRAPRSARSRAVEPEIELPEEPTYDDVEASDEIVAALAGGAALSFAPDDEDDLLPGGPAAAPADDRGRREPRGHRGGARPRGRRSRRGARRQRRDPGLSRHRRAEQRHPPAGPGPPSTNRSTNTSMATITAEMVKELRERTGAGHDGLQARPRGDRRRRRQGRRAAARARPRRGRQEGRARGARGPHLQLHPHRRPRGRAHRGQLRDRLRRPERGVPEARARPGDAGRRPDAELGRRRPIPAEELEREARRARCRTPAVAVQAGRDPRARSSTASSGSGTRTVVLLEQPFRDEDQPSATS